jgi:hypothetical protein
MYSSGASGRSSSLSGDAQDDGEDYYYLQQQQQRFAQQQQLQRPSIADDRRFSDSMPQLGGQLGRPSGNGRPGFGAESSFGGEEDHHLAQHRLYQQQHQYTSHSHSREMDAALGEYFPQQPPIAATRGGLHFGLGGGSDRKHFH